MRRIFRCSPGRERGRKRERYRKRRGRERREVGGNKRDGEQGVWKEERLGEKMLKTNSKHAVRCTMGQLCVIHP
jgi:hypothetical protein